MLSLDISAVLLILLNIAQMVTILLLLLPADVITLSKNIKVYMESIQNSSLLPTFIFMYVIIILWYGILGPTRTLNTLKRVTKQGETSREKLIRIIDSTNAIRNYLLGGLSLFYILVGWRLLDYITFSAKLHEFSNLMGNYDLIDITLKEAPEPEDTETIFIIDEDVDEKDSTHWPSIAELSKNEQSRLRTFFKATSKKGTAGSKTEATKKDT